MRFLRFIPLAATAALVASSPSINAQNTLELGTVLITAAKHETSLRHASTTSTVITSEELLRAGHRDVHEALRDIVSFDIAQSGGPGGISAPQMRGLPGRFMVVLVDGVRLNDPADANGGVGTVFSHLTTDMIERIEVVRGPQSPLYGSNAASGVINIITRKGSGKPRLGLSYQGGSLNSHRMTGDVMGSRGGFDYSLGQGVTATDGVIDMETYRNYATSAKIGWSGEEGISWESSAGFTRIHHNFAEFNENFDSDYGGSFWAEQTPDPNQKMKIDYLSLGNRLTHSLRENWNHQFIFGFSRRDRHTVDPDDGLLGYMDAPYDGFTLDWMDFYQRGEKVPVRDTPWGEQDYRYRGSNYNLDYRHTLSLSGAKASDIITAGVEYLYQNYDQSGTYGELSNNLHTTSLYLNNQTLLADDALSINSGLRYDNHEETRSSTTGMLGAAWDIRAAGLILRANYGSAFRAPAVYELFNPDNGNTGLKPETSVTREIGLEKYGCEGRYRLSFGWWHTRIDDAIVWVLTDPGNYLGYYQNFSKAESRGLEAELKLRLSPGWLTGFNYTYTDSRKYDRSVARWSRNVQLPYNKFNLNLTWLDGAGTSVSADGYWVDDSRLRWNGIEKMDGYFKLDLTARKTLGERFTGTLSLRNILDRDYFEGMGYREAGFNAFGGLELRY